jgi:thiamine-monophosphate kinase
MPGPVDEFDWIAGLRSLTLGDPRALGLMDDAAVLPAKPGFDLLISKDALIEGVHVPFGEAPDIIARRLLRTSLSDLAAKAAAPFGYFLLTAFPPGADEAWRAAFKRGLEADGLAFGVALLGGDTVSTAGPLVISATVLGWAPAGRAVLRSGARAGDALMICGHIGDGWLGLQAVEGRVADPDGALAAHYRLPTPLLSLREALVEHVRACADVSDGLIADAGHIAEASGIGVSLDLDAIPLSAGASAWLAGQADSAAARLSLAVGGDDYALVCAVEPGRARAFAAAVEAQGVPVAQAGTFGDIGTRITASGASVTPARTGWRHT